MKKALIILILCLSSFVNNAQDVSVNRQDMSVDKSITGVQIGFYGVDVYNEFRLDDQWALRSQVGLMTSLRMGALSTHILDTPYYPDLVIEPKLYYNLKKRAKKNRNINHNSANYFAIQLKYSPNWFIISDASDLPKFNLIQIIPTFGIRRSFSKNFNYEFKVGYGYLKKISKTNNVSGITYDIGIKIGYDF